MTELLFEAKYYIVSVLANENVIQVMLLLFPFILLVEIPYYIVLICAVIKKWIRIYFIKLPSTPYAPTVTVVITAYAEKEKIYLTLDSLCEQLYPGYIEILAVVDDAPNNQATVNSIKKYMQNKQYIPANRTITIIEKKTRGGLANSRNVGLSRAKGEVIMVIDADTSVENRCVYNFMKHFQDNNVIALSGGLRVRNETESMISRIQTIEYKLGIELSRYGLSEMRVLNNISGAFGVFRVSLLKKIGGWINGTAEDLDLILRLHSYAKRYPKLIIAYEPKSIAYTSVPATIREFFAQRSRWDGDLFYIYVRRHWRSFSWRLMGFWRVLITALYGLYYQIMLPFIIVFYYFYITFKYGLGTLLGITILIYFYYLIIAIFFYFLCLLIIPGTTLKELKRLPILIIMPIFQLIYKATTLLFILNEIFFKGHRDTNMAPWWIIKRTK